MTRIDAAEAVLRHRGPDGSGRFNTEHMAMLHTRLSIIDLDHGAQPLYSDDGKLVLVANGEIYNYIELRELLIERGYRFSTNSDCEVILSAYREFGDDFISRLYGMFAFALYDVEKEQLIIARDRLGIKPLFLGVDAKGVYFASEIKALLHLQGNQPNVNPAGIIEYLQNNFTSGGTTLFQGIERVLPGEAVCIDVSGISKRWKYWNLHYDKSREQITVEEACEEFDALMHDVMKMHLRSDVPIGLFLSGGLDSAVLLALFKEHIDESINTYSVGFPGTGVTNELNAASKISERFGTSHQVIELNQQDLLKVLPQVVWAADELMGDYANLPVYILAEQAAKQLKVVFSGEGGDEVFAGYARYRQPKFKYWLKNLRYPGSGGFRMSKTVKSGWERSLYSPALWRHRDDWGNPFIHSWGQQDNSWQRLSRMQAVDIETWLPDDLLVKADRMLMVSGLEGRVPFLDHRIVEFGVSLPASLKIQQKTGKVFLRKWAERYLPKEHIWSKKSGFSVPVSEWMRGETLHKLEKYLLNQPGIREWFRAEGIRALVRHQHKKENVSMVLWRLWQFGLWHDCFIVGDGSRPNPDYDALIGRASNYT